MKQRVLCLVSMRWSPVNTDLECFTREEMLRSCPRRDCGLRHGNTPYSFKGSESVLQYTKQARDADLRISWKAFTLDSRLHFNWLGIKDRRLRHFWTPTRTGSQFHSFHCLNTSPISNSFCKVLRRRLFNHGHRSTHHGVVWHIDSASGSAPLHHDQVQRPHGQPQQSASKSCRATLLVRRHGQAKS